MTQETEQFLIRMIETCEDAGMRKAFAERLAARARVGKVEVDRAFDDGARFAIAMKSAKPVEVESAKHDAFIEWFHNPHRTKLEYPYSGDSALAFHAGYDARITDTELTRLKRQVEVLREGLEEVAYASHTVTEADCAAAAREALAAADRIAKGEV